MSSRSKRFHLVSSGFLEAFLAKHQASLAVSTYQAGRVILLFGQSEKLHQVVRRFRRPMGMAYREETLIVATKHELVLLHGVGAAAAGYPKAPGRYDALFMPRARWITGALDLHDLHILPDRTVLGVNTLFSSITRFDGSGDQSTVWKPPFITDQRPSDACHLNGMAVSGDDPAFVTLLAPTATRKGWRVNRLASGQILRLRDNALVADGLPMPHSPRLYAGNLYWLHAATGALMVAPVGAPSSERMSATEICRVGGFARGLAIQDDVALVGHSHIRPGTTFADLPVASSATKAGITAIDLKTGNTLGKAVYHTDCHEIYDLQWLPNQPRPGLVGIMDDLHTLNVHHEDRFYWSQKAKPKN